MSETIVAPATGVLDYEAMVERYNRTLFHTLRHHQASDDLDTWVPDDDPARSILNMVEAAETSGRASLAVHVATATLAHLDLGALETQLSSLGTVTIVPDETGAVVQVAAIGGRAASTATSRSTDIFAAVGPVYRDAVRAAAGSNAHEGPVDLPHGTISCAVSRDGVMLEIAVGDDHVIRAAGFRGTASRVDRAIMDRLCAILTGLPVQEAHDHAAIRLEYALRDLTARRPVAGIVKPENADPAFVRPARLVRAIVARYAQTTGFRLGENTFAPRVSDSWMVLDRDAKLAALNDAARTVAPELGLDPDQVRIVDLETPIKAVVAFRDDLDPTRKPALLMQLEHRLHALEPTLQLFSVELKDANAIRRL